MNDTKGSKKEKNQHIQVFVRVRPMNNMEKNGKSSVVVDVPSNKEVLVREKPLDKISKKFTFDKVFGPASKQIDVYKAVVSPLLEEVLAGYNCTVFAYGQTGTGKTFTMEGVANDPSLHWQSDTTAGIIPRSLSHLFDELRLLEVQEYTVRISFLELYNEELFDLLSPNDDASKIRLYEDASKKGAVIIHGLEEVTVHNKNEVYKILEKGSEKRRTAATLMNAQSSRSHTVFSITIHIKENTVDGEELLKTGKLNLVDLAGSENVGRSGAVDRRAREAGNINQSLLTLGRVITALVERTPHIPYRESKLTRLLQESLGGRTKTSIIATISPASINLEETLSTLDYAHRAKNITNRPEINQKLSKKALLKEYTEEIERLRRDLLATRERNGVYLAQDNYNEMQALIEFQGKEIEEKINHIKALEETMQNKEEIFNELQIKHEQAASELCMTKNKLESTIGVLKKTKTNLHLTKRQRDEQKHLVEKHAATEEMLLSQAQDLLKVADVATTDTYKLHDKISRKVKVEYENEILGQQFRQDIGSRFQCLENELSANVQELIQFCMSIKNQINTQSQIQKSNIDEIIKNISKDLMEEEQKMTENLTHAVSSNYAAYQAWFEKEIQTISDMTEEKQNLLNNIVEKLAPKFSALVTNGISENLKTLNHNVSEKLQKLLEFQKNSIDAFCNSRMRERDYLVENIGRLKENISIILANHGQYVEKQEHFAKVFENACLEFNNLKKNHQEYDVLISSKMNSMNEICTDLNNQIISSCNTNLSQQTQFQTSVENDIQVVQDDISKGLEQNSHLAVESENYSKNLVDELQTDIKDSCNSLMDLKHVIESNVNSLQSQTMKDEQTLLTSLQKIHETVLNAGDSNISLLEQQKLRILSNSEDLSRKFDHQSTESTNHHNKVTAELRVTQHQVDKFIVEDLRRDHPTGSTPVRKEFNYSDNLVRTSPHEKIIQRFREVRGYLKSSDKTNTTSSLDNSTLESTLVSSSLDCTLDSPARETISCISSTPYNNKDDEVSNKNNETNSNLVRAASIPDLSDQLKVTCARTFSATDLHAKTLDKENSDDQFTKTRKIPEPISKLKTTNRRVLGSYN